jgi:AraC-like DNA-binding protein
MEWPRYVSGALACRLLAGAIGDPDRVDEVAIALGGTSVSPKPDEFVAISDWPAVWSGLASIAVHENFGLRAGSTITLEDLGLLGGLLEACNSTAQAQTVFETNQRLITGALDLEFQRRGSLLLLRPRQPSILDVSRHAVEFAFAGVVATVRELLGGAVPFRETRFRHPPPASVDEYPHVLGMPVVFDAGENALVAAASVGERRPVPTNALHAYLHHRAGTLLATVASQPTTMDRLRGAYEKAVTNGEASLRAVARSLALSSRTLQRRLRRANTTHRAMVDAARHMLAVKLMEQHACSIDDIAERVGYSELRAFIRAFRRWTGESPAAFRRRVAPAD